MRNKTHHKPKVHRVVNCRCLLCSSPAALAVFIQDCHRYLLLTSPCETTTHTGKELKVLQPRVPFTWAAFPVINLEQVISREQPPFLSHLLQACRISISISRVIRHWSAESPRNGHGPKAARAAGAFGQRSWAQGGIFGGSWGRAHWFLWAYSNSGDSVILGTDTGLIDFSDMEFPRVPALPAASFIGFTSILFKDSLVDFSLSSQRDGKARAGWGTLWEFVLTNPYQLFSGASHSSKSVLPSSVNVYFLLWANIQESGKSCEFRLQCRFFSDFQEKSMDF